jgi:hypothetical protein
MSTAGAALAALVLVAAGCAGAAPSDSEVIRGWSTAVNDADYERAGSFFAAGAVVEQQPLELRLPDQAAAARFSSGLPCRADVTDVEDEGRSGACAEGGRARVRFVIREGKIAEWRQLPETPGEVAGALHHLGFAALSNSSPGGSPCQASAVA